MAQSTRGLRPQGEPSPPVGNCVRGSKKTSPNPHPAPKVTVFNLGLIIGRLLFGVKLFFSSAERKKPP